MLTLAFAFAVAALFFILRPWQTRTHCCGHIVADTNVSPFACARNVCCGHKFCVRDTKNVSDFVQKHFVSATNVSQFAQPKKHHGQQCVLVYQGLIRTNENIEGIKIGEGETRSLLYADDMTATLANISSVEKPLSNTNP